MRQLLKSDARTHDELNAQIFLLAAQMVDASIKKGQEAFSCVCIHEASYKYGVTHCPAVEYEEWFKPFPKANSQWGQHWARKIPDRNRARVLALCFAAAIASTGDL